jgi:uncharacterized membrane protein
MMAGDESSPPPHVEETVAALVQLHVDHQQHAGAARRFVTGATTLVSRPRTLLLVTLLVAGWIAANVVVAGMGGEPLDPFPFPLLGTMLAALALYLATMILIVQSHDDELAARRAQLTLELAMLSDRKTAKIIALLEEFRRHDPNQSRERDEVAEALAEPADPYVVLSAIRSAHEKAGAPQSGLTRRAGEG